MFNDYLDFDHGDATQNTIYISADNNCFRLNLFKYVR